MIEEATLYLAECHIELREADAALGILIEPCNDDNVDYKAHILAARAHILKDNQVAALDCLETAGKLAPDNPDILLLVAALHIACQNTEAALEIYGRVLFSDPQNIDALIGQVRHLLKAKAGISLFRTATML